MQPRLCRPCYPQIAAQIATSGAPPPQLSLVGSLPQAQPQLHPGQFGGPGALQPPQQRNVLQPHQQQGPVMQQMQVRQSVWNPSRMYMAL